MSGEQQTEGLVVRTVERADEHNGTGSDFSEQPHVGLTVGKATGLERAEVGGKAGSEARREFLVAWQRE